MKHENIYPEAPGHRWVDTSMEAAEAIAPKVAYLQRIALAAVVSAKHNGLTVDELCASTDRERYSLQPRITELKLLGTGRGSRAARRP